MSRMLLGVAALLTGVGLLVADEYRGTIKTVDAKELRVTVTINGKDKTFEIPKSPMILTADKTKGKGPAPGLDTLKAGLEVLVITEKQGDAEIATTFKLGVGKKK